MRRVPPYLLIGGVALVAVAVAGFMMLRDQGGPAKASLTAGEAVRPAAVAALGRIEAQSETINLGGAATDVLADLAVGRGSRVTRGETIGHFRGYQEAVARERATAQQFAEAKAQLGAEQAVGESRVRSAQAQLDGILAVGPARIDSQVARVRSAEIDLANNIDIL